MKNKDMEEKEENTGIQVCCWLCKRGFIESIEEFNVKVLSNKYTNDDIKSRYEKGKKEFFPLGTDKYVKFWIANVKNGAYSMSGHAEADVLILLCPVCNGLLESLLDEINENDEKNEELYKYKELGLTISQSDDAWNYLSTMQSDLTDGKSTGVQLKKLFEDSYLTFWQKIYIAYIFGRIEDKHSELQEIKTDSE